MRKYLPAFILGLFSVSAFAGDYGSGEKVSFESLDKDSDQQISMTEARAHEKLATSFSEADTDGDGYVSQEEFEAFTGGA